MLFDALFEAVRQTLLAFASYTKHLGATPAITAVLHTWTRELVFHPHLHAIVSASGWNDASGRWISTRRRFLFPVTAMAKVFRGKMRAAVLDGVTRGAVVIDAADEPSVRRALFETRWVVYAKPPFGSAHHVFAYLGRYTHRVGISNARLLEYDRDTVTFATKFRKSVTLESGEFSRRFLRHTLPPGFHEIRHFGVASASCVRRGVHERARLALAPDVRDDGARARAPSTTSEILLALTGVDLGACRSCGSRDVRIEPLGELDGQPPQPIGWDSS